MEFPRVTELFREGILVGWRTRPVGGQPAELWELSDQFELEPMFQELLDVARYVLEKHPAPCLPRLVQKTPLVVSGAPWVPLAGLCGKPCAPEIVISFVHDLACGLEKLPDELALRSLSPKTLAITIDGRARVLDCTLSAAAVRPKTQPGVLKGELPYMSPEQAMGRPLDARSDVAVVAIMMLELLVGEHPAPRTSSLDMLRAMQAGIPVPDHELVPPKLRGLLEWMLQPDRTQRLEWSGVAGLIERDLRGYLWSKPRLASEMLRAQPKRPVM